MIIDRIENAGQYFHFHGFENGLAKLRSLGKDAEHKRYDFDGGYFFITEGDTIPAEEGKYEAHRKYMDVQYILAGSEEVAWANIGDIEEVDAYSEENDAALYIGETKQINTITAGMFWIALPQDAHKPARHRKASHHFIKVVFKLPIMG